MGKFTVKIFDVGTQTGTINFRFTDNETIRTEIVKDSNGNDREEHYMSTEFALFDVGGQESPILFNPNSSDKPTNARIVMVGNTEASASGIFRVKVHSLLR